MDDEVQASIGLNSLRRLEKCSYQPPSKEFARCLLYFAAAVRIYICCSYVLVHPAR